MRRRAGGEPVAYIVGMRGFWTLDLVVTPDVLIPRPDSETLIEAAAALPPPARVLDLGTGSGALLLAALDVFVGAWGLGVDRSARALDVARSNAAATGLAARAGFALGDWGAAAAAGAWDLVLANPPYIASGAALPRDVGAFEPHAALFAGADGLDALRRVVADMPRLLAPGGHAVVEFGHDQAEALGALAAAAGLRADVRADLGGRARAAVLARG